jgi:hypothetical protein
MIAADHPLPSLRERPHSEALIPGDGPLQRQSLPALLAAALNETVVVTIDGRRRKITKREAIVALMSTNRRVQICARPRC